MADKVDKKEIQEAQAVANEVLILLKSVEKELKSARNWGLYDIFGGGFFASWIKFGKVGKAEKRLQKVQIKLEDLQKELGDLQLGLNASIDISSFQRFVDLAFDHMIVDWMTQSKINESLNDVARLTNEVEQIIKTLDKLEQV